MRKLLVIAALIALVAWGASYALHTKVKLSDGAISLDQGGHHVEGYLGQSERGAYLLKDMGISLNTVSGDAFVMVLALEKADQLRARYGDFSRCSSVGTDEVMRSMVPVVLVASDRQVKDDINRALKLIKGWKIPVVAISGRQVVVTKHTYFKADVDDQTGTIIVYATDFRVIRDNYP